MQLNPYLTFDGNCREAFAFYAAALRGEVTLAMTYAESPMAADVPADWQQKTCHAEMRAGNCVLMGADSMPNQHRAPQGVSVSIVVDDVTEAQRIFDALSSGGGVDMPLQQTFWARAFGCFTDRFGIHWLVSGEMLDFAPK